MEIEEKKDIQKAIKTTTSRRHKKAYNPPYDGQETNKLDINRKTIFDLYAQTFTSFGNRIIAVEILTHNFHLRVTELEQKFNQLNERIEELIRRFNESLIATRSDLINILKIINDDTSRTTQSTG